MLTAVYYNNHDVRIQGASVPTIGEDEALLKVMASGICGSDVIEWYRVPKAPIVLGHEATGIIDKVGGKVSSLKVGERVFVSHHVPCNQCRYCKRSNHTACHTLHTTNYFPGGFSQYIRIPKINIEYGVYRLPDDMSFEEGTFIEPLACVCRGQRLAGLKKDDTCLIIGSGIAGVLHVQLARFKGLKNIIVTDINPFRLRDSQKIRSDRSYKRQRQSPGKTQRNKRWTTSRPSNCMHWRDLSVAFSLRIRGQWRNNPIFCRT